MNYNNQGARGGHLRQRVNFIKHKCSCRKAVINAASKTECKIVFSCDLEFLPLKLKEPKIICTKFKDNLVKF
jgi:hypothetical protein